MLRRLTAPLRAAAPDDQLAEVTTEIAELARDMARLEAERSSLIVAKLGGDPEAEARVTAIDAEATAIRRRLADLRQAEGRLRSEIAASAQLELDEAATAGRRRLAELHQRSTTRRARFDEDERGARPHGSASSAGSRRGGGRDHPLDQIKRWPLDPGRHKSAMRCGRTSSSTRGKPPGRE